MDLHAVAHRIGQHRWTERQLFEAMGAWAVVGPEQAVTHWFATQCQRHAWHAQLWTERLPALAGLDPDDVTRPGDPSVAAFVAALVEPDDPGSTIERLAGVCRVFLPRLVTAYRAMLDATDELVDGPTVRVLTLILRDETEAWQEGEALLQTLIRTPADAARAAEQQARLEAILVIGPGL